MNTAETIPLVVCSDGVGAAASGASASSMATVARQAHSVPKGLGWFERVLFALVYLFVAGLVLVAYVVARFRDPELFAWGQHLLSQERGLWMLAVLPMGGLALLAALQFARRGRLRLSAVALLVAVLAGGAFLALGAIDYDSKFARRLVPGKRFKPNERYVARRFGVRLPKDWSTRSMAPTTPVVAATPAPPVKREISATSGRELFLRVCASCHGPRGEGMTGSGKELRVNEFVAGRDDAKLVDFLRVGRQPWDPANTTKVQMPGRGGDPRVTDDDLRDVVAYLRDMQKRFAATSTASTGSGVVTQPTSRATSVAGQPPTSQAVEEPPMFIVHRSYIPDAPPGPPGLSPAYLARFARPKWAIPDDAQDYFGMFFVLTGFGGLHVLAALGAVMAVLVTVLRRRLPYAVPSRLVAATAAWWWATGCWGLVHGLLYV